MRESHDESTPIPDTPVQAVPVPGTPVPGTPCPGTPMFANPRTRFVALPRTPMPGTPMFANPRTPAPKTPMPGTPMHGTPMRFSGPGTPMPGTPMLGPIVADWETLRNFQVGRCASIYHLWLPMQFSLSRRWRGPVVNGSASWAKNKDQIGSQTTCWQNEIS